MKNHVRILPYSVGNFVIIRIYLNPFQVNLVQESHRLVLVVEASPNRVKDSKDKLVAVLQEHSS